MPSIHQSFQYRHLYTSRHWLLPPTIWTHLTLQFVKRNNLINILTHGVSPQSQKLHTQKETFSQSGWTGNKSFSFAGQAPAVAHPYQALQGTHTHTDHFPCSDLKPAQHDTVGKKAK